MKDAREIAATTIEYLEVGRAILIAQGTLTRHQERLFDRAMESLAAIRDGKEPLRPSGPFSSVSNVR